MLYGSYYVFIITMVFTFSSLATYLGFRNSKLHRPCWIILFLPSFLFFFIMSFPKEADKAPSPSPQFLWFYTFLLLSKKTVISFTLKSCKKYIWELFVLSLAEVFCRSHYWVIVLMLRVDQALLHEQSIQVC